MSERRCASYEGCMGTGVLDDLSDSGSGRTVYCNCAAGILLRQLEAAPTIYGNKEPTIYGNAGRLLQESRHTISEVETVAVRAERLASRYTRYDGSPR